MASAGRGRPGHGPGSPATEDLVLLAFDDAVLDRLAARTRRTGTRGVHRRAGDPAGDRISELLTQWQDRLTARTEPAPLDADRAAQLVASAPRRSALRPAMAIAAAICLLLVGSAAIGARTAQPGDPLFPVTQVLWTQQADSAVAGQRVHDMIGAARSEVAAGRLTHAADLLREAAHELSRVTVGRAHADAEGDLLAVWALLSRANAAAGKVMTDGDVAGVPAQVGAPDPQVGGPPTPAAADGNAADAGGVVAPASARPGASHGHRTGSGSARVTSPVAAAPGGSGTAAGAGAGGASTSPSQHDQQPPAPATSTPTTGAGTSAAPTTGPVSPASPTVVPTTAAPTTEIPTTGAPATPSPTGAPTTPPPTSTAPEPPPATTAPPTSTSSDAASGRAMAMPAMPTATGGGSAATSPSPTPPPSGPANPAG